MKNRIAVILSGAVLLGIASGTQQPRPRRTVDLPSLAVYRDAAETTGALPNGVSLVFLDNSTIAVLVQFRFLPKSAEDDSLKLAGTHYNTAVVTIDARDGTSQKSHVWNDSPGLPAILLGSGIHSTGSSGCLVIVGRRLLGLSHELEVVAKRDLPLNPVQSNGFMRQDQWTVLTDPRSKKALLVHFPFIPETTGRESGDAHWISVDTLEDESTISVSRWEGAAAALIGESLIFNELGAKGPAAIQVNGKEPRPLCAECIGAVEGTFGNGSIFLGRLNEYSVRDTNGTILYHEKKLGGRADTIGGVSGAMTSNRVAFLFGHLGRELEETAVIVDVDAQKEIWRLDLHQRAVSSKVGGFARESFPSPRLALSPDGKKLAIISADVLSVFEIP